MDRFALQFNLGYVPAEEEVLILTAQEREHPLEQIAACVSLPDVVALKRTVKEVRVAEELKHYIVELTSATRTWPGVQLGASPRASITLMKLAQALAVYDGQDFVTPDHIRELAEPVIAHRLAMEPQAKFSGLTARGVVQEVLKKVPPPR